MYTIKKHYKWTTDTIQMSLRLTSEQQTNKCGNCSVQNAKQTALATTGAATQHRAESNQHNGNNNSNSNSNSNNNS